MATQSLSFPAQSSAEISSVDQIYLKSRTHYQSVRQAQASKLRRRLIKRRQIFQRRLERVLSPQLRAELQIHVVLDTQYLSRPTFIAQFEDCGQIWHLRFQPQPWGGRWFFRAEGQSKLYSCGFKQLETQLCYALGQYRFFSCLALRA